MDMTTALMAAQTGSGMQGVGQKIGAALFGNSDAAYQKGMERAMSVEDKMLDARKKRDAEMGRMARKSQMIAAGVDPAQADLLNSLFNAGDNPEQLSGYQMDQQKLGWGDNAMAEAVGGGDLELINRMNMVRDGKPVDLTKIDDHTAINPMALPESQDLDMVTLLGEAMAADENASAGRHTAQAGVYDAQAAVGGYNPNTGRGKTLTPVEAQTKVDWIMAQANQKATKGEPAELVDAWVRNEMLQAGLQPEPEADRAPSASVAGQPAAPQTEAEYNALPSGALFVDPDDGKTYRKP